MCFVMDLRESLEIVSLKISEYLITGRFCPIYRSERSEYSRNWKIGGKFGQFEKKKRGGFERNNFSPKEKIHDARVVESR